MNKSLGLLKSLMKKNLKYSHQTMEVNHSHRYSPNKKVKKQIFSIKKLSQPNCNSNIEMKKNIYQQSKFDKMNKFKSIKNNNNLEENNLYRKKFIYDNNINNINKNSQDNNKTINNSKKKSYNMPSQKNNIGSKSYVDLFQNNICNSNDFIKLGGVGVGKTISNSIYDKIYDFEINNTNSNDYNNLVEEMNNIINILINYIKIIKEEYEKIIIKKIQNKDKEIKKLENEKSFLIKENKKLKFLFLEMFYCIKKHENSNEKYRDIYSLYIRQIIDENIYLRKCINKSNDINKNYYFKLEKEIHNQILQKDLSMQTNFKEEEKNNNKEKEENNENNNPFKYISNSNNSSNMINHKRQRTQFKIGTPVINENNQKLNKDDKINTNKDILSGYLNIMNNNNISLNKDKKSSQNNLLLIKNGNSNNKDDQNNNIYKNNVSINENNNLSNSSSTDTVIHNKENINNENNEKLKEDKESTNKKIESLSYFSSDEKYIQRIEFTK